MAMPLGPIGEPTTALLGYWLPGMAPPPTEPPFAPASVLPVAPPVPIAAPPVPGVPPAPGAMPPVPVEPLASVAASGTLASVPASGGGACCAPSAVPEADGGCGGIAWPTHSLAEQLGDVPMSCKVTLSR